MKTRVRVKTKLLKNLGCNIQKLRTSKNITQEELAELISSDRSYIGAIEQGRKSPSIYCLYSIAVALKVKLSQIVDFDVQELNFLHRSLLLRNLPFPAFHRVKVLHLLFFAHLCKILLREH